MIELISIHIPKTAGTSFYHILRQVYGGHLSISYKRRDFKKAVETYGSFEKSLTNEIKVLHGHFHYSEIRDLHRSQQPKIICWLRDPVDRVVSNYRFFIDGLNNPDRNPRNYTLNKHRLNETLDTYASLPENQNRMSTFLKGIQPEDLFFVGLLETFETDLKLLGQKLNWPTIQVPQLNTANQPKIDIPESTIRKIKTWNYKDQQLYEKIIKQK